MKYTSEFDSINSICRVCVNGIIHGPKDADELKQFARDFFVVHGCRYFLFDMKQTDIVLGTMGAFYTGAPQGEMAESLRPFKVAAVVQEITEDLSLFEDVAVNRGFNVHVFDDIDKAVEWLRPG
jgi:hypothetical protein